MEEQILIDVDIDVAEVASKLSETIQKLSELKEEQKKLTKSIQEGNDVNGTAARQYAENEAAISRLKAEQKSLTNVVQQQTGALSGYGDSLTEMRRKLNDMTKSYNSMTAAQRDSARGREFLQALQEQYKAVSELEHEIGQHQRNVGNYPKVVTSIIPGFDRLQSTLSAMGVSFGTFGSQGVSALNSIAQSVGSMGRLFITPPIVIIAAVLGAIALVVDKLRDAFKKNDDAATNLQRAFAQLQPIVSAVGALFDKLAVVLSNMIVKVAEFTGKVASLAAGLFGLRDAYQEAAGGADDLVVSTDKLQEAERAYAVESAKRESEISRLRAEAADKEKHTAREREQMLAQAADLERANLDDRKRIAQERVRLLQMEAEQNSDTSDEMKDKIASATAELYKAEKAYADGVRALNKGITQARQENAADAAAAAKKRQAELDAQAKEDEQRAKEQEQEERNRAKIRESIEKELQDALVAAIEDDTERKMAAEELSFQRQRAARLEQLATLADDEVEARANLRQLIEVEQQAHQERLRAISLQAWETEQAERAAQLTQGAQTDMERKEAELVAAEEHYMALNNMDEEQKAAMFASEEEYQQAVAAADEEYKAAMIARNDEVTKAQQKALEDRKKIAQQNAAAISNVMGSVSQVLDEFAEDNKAAAVASKAIALGQIAVQTGVAIAEGVAAASGVVFPANLAAIATTIATVVANIATAISTVKSAKFAEGGIVGGNSYRGDKLVSYLNSGEVVLNDKQQANLLFAIANSNLDAESNRQDALVDAVAALPAPVLDYQEFSDFSDRVASIREFANN